MVTTYENWRVGDVINICASIDEFCGAYSQFIFPKDINVTKSPDVCSLTFGHEGDCGLHLNNVEFTFKLVKVTGSAEGKNCAPIQVYKTIGSARTNSNGACVIVYTITEQDRLDFINAGGIYKVMACITNADGNPTISGDISIVTDNIAISVIPEPTHSVTMQMAFVPSELVSMLSDYITGISDGVMSYLTPLPSPWTYIKTTYDKVSNSFNILLYLPITVSGGIYGFGGIYKADWIDDRLNELINWVKGVIDWWLPVVLGILAIIAALAGAWHIAFILAAFALTVGWRINDLRTNLVKAQEAVKNLNSLNQGNGKEDKGRKSTEDEWDNSPKTNTDCTKRLEKHRDVHIAKIDGLIGDFSKYASLISKLREEKASFTTSADNIISEFKNQPYTEAVCNTYYVKIDTAIRDSNIKISEYTSTYIDPDKTYETPCTGWITKGDCETAKCYWYDNKCHSSPSCWIPSLTGGCILSAGTGKKIVYAGGAALGIYGAYLVYKALKPEKTAMVEVVGGK